jgi:hypothetical protein
MLAQPGVLWPFQNICKLRASSLSKKNFDVPEPYFNALLGPFGGASIHQKSACVRRVLPSEFSGFRVKSSQVNTHPKAKS